MILYIHTGNKYHRLPFIIQNTQREPIPSPPRSRSGCASIFFAAVPCAHARLAFHSRPQASRFSSYSRPGCDGDRHHRKTLVTLFRVMTLGHLPPLFSPSVADRTWRSPSRAWIGWILAFSSLAVSAETIIGRVVGVSDGDTLTVLSTNDQQFKIRLSGIDAPEKGQPFGNRAKESLSEMVFEKQVVVESNKEDRYRRKVGKVQREGTDVNLEQVKRGMAWHYTAYAKEQAPSDREVYANAEAEAKTQRRGLWRETTPSAPWEFRRIKAAGRQAPKGN